MTQLRAGLCLLALAMACEGTGEGGGASDAGRQDAAVLDAADADASAPLVTLTFDVYDALSGDPIEGARFCDHPARATCWASDAAGRFTVQAPAGTEQRATLEADGYYSRYFVTMTPEVDTFLGRNAMQTRELIEVIVDLVGLQLQDANAVIGASVLKEAGGTDGWAGVTLSLEPSHPTYYLTESSMLSREQAGTAASGTGLWIDVPPGTYAVRYEGHPGCTITTGLPTGTDGEIAVEALAGHWTHVDVVCPE